MHILFLTDNFPPEANAPAARTFDHARRWQQQGHRVTIVTCAPNFPEGRVFEGYENSWLCRESVEEISVWRVKTYIAANDGFGRRAIDFISFMVSSFIFGMFVKKVDIVVGTSPQFLTVVSAWGLAKCKRVPFVFELRDMWPASITAIGMTTSSWLMNFLEKIESFLYSQADMIISVTQSFKSKLIARGLSADKIKVVKNGVDLEEFKPLRKKDPALAKLYQLNGKFVAGYVGTHGMAHSLDTVIGAAERLRHNREIKIILVGGGAQRIHIERLVAERDLQNVLMIPRQPRADMQRIWSLCDVALVPLKNSELFSTVIPSKIFESMAMGLPVVISVPEGEATDIVRRYETGLVVPPENIIDMAKAITALKNDGNLYKSLSANSLAAAKRFDRRVLALDMLDHIEDLVLKRRR